MADQGFITFGPVHLEVRDARLTARFWQEVADFERRASHDGNIEVGTTDEQLLVLHGGARTPCLQGHSGLYHIAIHAPDERDFARMLKRFGDLRYSMSPTDHTSSKSTYLDDPDGVFDAAASHMCRVGSRQHDFRRDTAGIHTSACDETSLQEGYCLAGRSNPVPMPVRIPTVSTSRVKDEAEDVPTRSALLHRRSKSSALLVSQMLVCPAH